MVALAPYIKVFNLARMTTATTGTGTITLGSAATYAGVLHLSFADAGVADGDVVYYGISDANGTEVGYGTYTASGTTLTRNVIDSTNGGSAINLSGNAQVYIIAPATQFTDPTNVASINTGPLAGFRNRLVNGCARLNQREGYFMQGATNCDDRYGFDRWVILAQDGDTTGTVTFTNGLSAVGWTGHNRVVGDAVQLTTTGTLPTGFATGTTYYVRSVTDANTITLALSPVHTAIVAASAGSGTHTATGNSITPSQVALIEDEWVHAMRHTQNQATASRFGIAQIVEGNNCIEWRGKTVTLQARVRMSGSTTLRYAILEWTGTQDSVTSDVVNDWTSGTFTTGNFFISSNWTIRATGSKAFTAATPDTLTLTTTLGTTFTNLMVIFWTDSAQAQNEYFDIGKIQLEEGSVASEFERRPISIELFMSQRYAELQGGVNADRLIRRAAPGTTSGAQYNPVSFFGFKRVQPTLSLINYTLSNTTNPNLFNAFRAGLEFYHEITAGGGFTFFGFIADSEL